MAEQRKADAVVKAALARAGWRVSRIKLSARSPERVALLISVLRLSMSPADAHAVAESIVRGLGHKKGFSSLSRTDLRNYIPEQPRPRPKPKPKPTPVGTGK